MIFFLVMPSVYDAFVNVFMLILIGSPEVVYPRINIVSVLLVPLSYTVMHISLNTEFGTGFGWTLYPPLSISGM